MERYDHNSIEPKQRKRWETEQTYKTATDTSKPKCYVLDMFPYPSGVGLHVGHPKGYIATDIYSRYKRMSGFNVLHPMGFDAFGLPAENYAIKNKIHPRVAVDANIKHFKEQLSVIGLDYDWSRQVDTTDPAFYKWSQWIFLKLLEKGLAYESYEPINWCPSCQTGLANEDIEDGKCERCGTVVEKRPMRQWVLKITDYADRLLSDLEGLNWSESIKDAQRNWIGRSEGAEIDFKIKGTDDVITVFTTRADTLFGVTYVVLAPEHALVAKLAAAASNASEITQYVAEAKTRTTIERTAEGKEKTGVRIEGTTAINPANGEEVPVWIADYVLADYGTGAVMAVPAHDERDHLFAKKYDLPVREVIEPVTGKEMPNEEFRQSIVAVVEDPKTGKILCLDWTDEYGGKLFVGGGLEEGEDPAQAAIREIQEETGYKNLRVIQTAGVSHHHYFAHSKKVARNIEVTGVHLELIDEERAEPALEETEKDRFTVMWITREEAERDVKDENHALYFQRFIRGKAYTGSGILKNSLTHDGKDSVSACADIGRTFGRPVVRYKLRDWVFSRQRYWGEPIPVVHCEKDGVVAVTEDQLPVMLPEVESYAPTGTGESPLADIPEWVNTTCPKCGGPAKRETNTMPQWAGSSWYYLRYMDPHNTEALVSKEAEKYFAPVDLYVGGTEHATRHLIYARFWHKFLYDIGSISTVEPFMRLYGVGLIMGEDGRKMGKRFGNAVDPVDVINQYGADTFRMFEMFLGPFEQQANWNTASITGPRRFIERAWKLAHREFTDKTSQDAEIALSQTISKVESDIERFAFNTAISSLMTLSSELEKASDLSKESFLDFVRILAPFAPHVTEEIWTMLGQADSIHTSPWPVAKTVDISTRAIPIAIQVNGKVRGVVSVIPGTSQEEVLAKAKEDSAIAKWLTGEMKKVVYVEGKLLSIVI
jgi:leucyl-tRNA synthetase